MTPEKLNTPHLVLPKIIIMIAKNAFVRTKNLLQAFHRARDSFLDFASRTNFLAEREVELT
jgi:hypothetical protein